jgi:predicted Zn-dependent protease
MKRFFTYILAALLIVSWRPFTVHAFTVGEEKEIGEKLLYAVRSSFPVIDDPDLQQYINELGKEVLEVAGIQFFDYRFYIVESNQFNAFAAPSGMIFFYTELIKAMNSEDELVSVLAHEIGHVVKRHLSSRVQKSAAINIASLGLALAALALGGGGAVAQTVMTGSLAAGQSAQLHYSRQDEIEADALAYQWLRELDRDPEGQRKMLQTMRRITRYRMGQVPQYLLTHPDPEARLDYVDSMILAEKVIDVNDDANKDFAFLRLKYRIMAMEKDNRANRAYLASILGDANAEQMVRVMAKYGLAQLNLAENNLKQSLAFLDEVIAALPHQQILIIDRAVILTQMGEFSQALEILEEHYRKNPYDMYGAYELAQVYERVGDKEKAERLYRVVIAEMPEFSEGYFALGRVLTDLGKEIEPRFYLATYHLYEGKLKLAQSEFKRVADHPGVSEEIREESLARIELIERIQKG